MGAVSIKAGVGGRSGVANGGSALKEGTAEKDKRVCNPGRRAVDSVNARLTELELTETANEEINLYDMLVADREDIGVDRQAGED